MASVWTRAGMAFKAGLPAGAAVNVAQSTSDDAWDPSAAFAGMSDPTQSGLAQNYRRIESGEVEAPESFLATLSRIAQFPIERVSYHVQAQQRRASELGSQGDFFGGLKFGLMQAVSWTNYLDPEFRATLGDVEDAEASLAQTIERSLSGEGFGLLDDPNRRAEREDYYSSFKMRMLTGIPDAAFNLIADPLNVIAAVPAVRSAGRLLTAEDVARVADRSIEFTQLTRRQQHARNAIDAVVMATEPGNLTDGTISALARTQFLSQTNDAGAIAYLMGRANAMPEFTDAAARRMFKQDVLAAAMGDQGALARLGEKSQALQAEVMEMSRDLSEIRWAETLAKPDGDMASLFDELHTQPSWRAGIEAQRAEVERTYEALERVRLIGDPAQGAGQYAAGGIRSTAGGGEKVARDIMRQYKWTQGGRALPGIHLMTGIHVPQTFRLGADDAPQVFDAALQRARGVVDDADLAALRDKFYATITYGNVSKVDRAAVLQQFIAKVEAGLAAKHNLDIEQVRALMTTAMNRRNAELGALRSRVFQARPGERVFFRTEDGTFAFGHEAVEEMRNVTGVVDLSKPVLATQMQDWVSLLDVKQIDRWFASQSGGSLAGMFTKVGNVWRPTEALMASANRFWKFSVLFRLSYPARVQIDSQARLLAKLKPIQYATQAAKGAGNWVHNWRKVDKAIADDYARRFRAAEQLDAVERRLASGDYLNAEESRALLSEADRLRQQIDAPAPKPTGTRVRVRHTDMRRALGLRRLDPKTGKLTGDIRDPYQNIGEMWESISKIDARRNIVGLLSNGETTRLRDLRGTGQWDLISGESPRWADAYVRAVNRQIRNDAAGRLIVSGQTDEQILRWLTTAEGRAYWRALAPRWAEAGQEAWLAQARMHIETLVPDDAARSFVSQQAVTPEDARRFWKTATERPSVPGELLEDVPQGPLAKTEDWWFKHANDLPENMLARHPFYAASFRGHIDDLLRRSGIDDTDALTLAQVNSLRRQAAILARRDVAKVMFDTSKQTNLGYHLRFLMPFYGAWWDVMSKWSGIFRSDPLAAVITPKVLAAPNAAGLVVDEEGRLIRSDGTIVDLRRGPDGKFVGTGEVVGATNVFSKGTIILPLPSWVQSWSGQENALIRKGSLNIIFQGDPFWAPGPGPLMQIPANHVMMNVFPELGPEMADSPIGKWLTQGFGLSDESIAEQLQPAWVRNLRTVFEQNMGEARFGQAYVLEYQSLLAEVEQGVIDPMSVDELHELAATRTRNKFIMQFLGSYVVPVSTSTEGRFQFYLDMYRQYQRDYGLDAYERFVNDYPEYKDLAISLSANTTGVQATIPAWETAITYRDEIARNPEFGWAFAGANNLIGEFDPNVYTLQRGSRIGQGTNETWRTSRDPMEAIRRAAVQKGWNQYWAMSSALNDVLRATGLTLQSDAAEELRVAKEAFIASLAAENPEWWSAYNEGAGGDTAVRFMSWAADQLESHPELGERSDFQALYQYMLARQAMQQALSRVGVSSIRSQAAQEAGLTAMWDSFTQALVAEDIGFEQMWVRARLEDDDLSGGVY
jgi:hypothetical protein